MKVHPNAALVKKGFAAFATESLGWIPATRGGGSGRGVLPGRGAFGRFGHWGWRPGSSVAVGAQETPRCLDVRRGSAGGLWASALLAQLLGRKVAAGQGVGVPVDRDGCLRPFSRQLVAR